MKGFNCSDESDEDEEDEFAVDNALDSAVYQGNIDFVKEMAPKTFLDDLSIYKLVKQSIHRNQYEMVEYLTSLPFKDLNLLDESGCSLLYWTIAKANKAMLQCLLDKKAVSANIRNKNNRAPLHYAANLKWLTQYAGKDVDFASLLDFSVFCCNELIKMGANLNIVDEDGSTPLHLAVSSGNVKVVEILLQHGADGSYISKQGTPLHVAVSKQDIAIICLLLNHSSCYLSCVGFDGDTPLHQAFRHNYCSIIDVLLTFVDENGINMVNSRDETVLHIAAESLSCGMVRRLLDLGADVNSRTKIGETPLIRCLAGKLPDHPSCELCLTVSELLRRGANVNLRLESGATPLHIALYSKRYCVMETLLNTSVEDKVLGSLLFNILNYIKDFEKVDPMLELLLFYGANLNFHREGDGYTPLHKTACDLGFYRSQMGIISTYIKFLIENGANVNEINAKGETPLHLVLKLSEPDMISAVINLFLENGADLTIKNNWGKALLSYILPANHADLKERFTSFSVRHMAAGQANYIKYNNESRLKIEVDEEFYNQCLDEVRLIKESCDNNISLFDIYCADDATLLEYLECSWDHSAVASNNYLSDNKHLYSALILCKIRRVLKIKQRQNVLSCGDKLLDHISAVFNIRKGSLEHCFGCIFKYLNYNDFRNIKASFEF